MAPTFSGKLFNRQAPRPFRREVADLEGLASLTDPERKATGANLEWDWRVSEDREQHIFDWITGRPVQRFDRALVDFCDIEIRRASRPDLFRGHNRGNRIDELAAQDLVNVLQFPTDPSFVKPGALTAGRRIDTTEGLLEELFNPDSGVHYRQDTGVEFNSTQKLFLEGCFTAASPRPVWAGLWDQFAKLGISNPNHWLSAFGVPARGRRLIFLFRYRLSDVKPVFRPTTIEAIECPQHYPSPPPACVWKPASTKFLSGGHPVSQHPASDSGDLLWEYIHKGFLRKTEMIRGWGWTDPAFALRDLVQARALHYARLDRSYTGINLWAEPNT